MLFRSVVVRDVDEGCASSFLEFFNRIVIDSLSVIAAGFVFVISNFCVFTHKDCIATTLSRCLVGVSLCA